jgi:hypothetical protein
MPRKQKKVMLVFKDGSTFVINLNWMKRNKSSGIRKHIFHVAREKDLVVKKVSMLSNKS